MKQFALSARSLPLDDSWDVIVAGGGPAGCAAAVAAARDGARTLLIEATGILGGMGTSGLVPSWCPFSDKERFIYGDIAQKIFSATKQGMPHVSQDAIDWVPIDAERLKRMYDELVTEAGVHVLFHTVLSAVETEKGSVKALIVSNKSGLCAKSAKVYIDCTGDADLCAWAGAEFHKGDAEGKGLMPATHCFVLSNVDQYAYTYSTSLYGTHPKSPMSAILASGKYPLIPDLHMCQTTVGPSTVGFNAGHVYEVDNTDPESLSKGLMAGRRLAAAYRDALAEFSPAAFGNAFLVQTGSLLGIRETRRIVGDYELTLEDYLKRRSFPDEIARNSYFIDVHAKAKSAFNDLKKFAEWEKTNFHYGKGESHGIPYRCLTPKGLVNVLVAGRSISTDQPVQGSARVMPCCLAMGEAAGAAAAMAARDSGDVRAISVARLRERLQGYGAYLPEVPAEASAAK